MTEQHERLRFPPRGPFGDGGDDVGDRAIAVRAVLLEDVPESLTESGGIRSVWSQDDFWAFENLLELETGVKFIDPPPDVDGGQIGDLHRTVARFHTALPLSEAERLWLFDPTDGMDEKRQRTWDIHKPESLLGVVEEVISGGIRQVIQGREVVRRLAAWRREADEFADQGTLDEACDALGEIATTLVTEENWPREHLDMRAYLLGGEQRQS